MEKLRSNKMIALLFACIIILQSGHALQTIFSSLIYLLYIPAIIAIVFLIRERGRINLAKAKDAALAIFFLMIVASMAVDMGDGAMFYLRVLVMVLGAYLISSLYSFEDMSKWYLRIMTVVSAVSLVGYVLVNNTSLLEALPTLINTNDVEYGVAIIFNYIKIIPDRNCAMFWEPGLFATHLAISMLLEMLSKPKPSFWRIALFTVCIFTANSSAGFVLWFLCMVFLLLKNTKGGVSAWRMIFSTVVLAAAFLLVANFDAILASTSLGENEYFIKLYSDNVSASTRSQAIQHNLKMFGQGPLFGAGYSNVTENMMYTADTSTSTFLMSVFGILGIFYTLFLGYGAFKIKKLNFASKVIVAAILIIIVNKEPHHQIFFTWILLFYLLGDVHAGGAREDALSVDRGES